MSRDNTKESKITINGGAFTVTNFPVCGTMEYLSFANVNHPMNRFYKKRAAAYL